MKYVRLFPRPRSPLSSVPRSPLILVKNVALTFSRRKSTLAAEGSTTSKSTLAAEDSTDTQPALAIEGSITTQPTLATEENTALQPALDTKKPKRRLLTHISRVPHLLRTRRSSSRNKALDNKASEGVEAPQLSDLIDHNIETIISLHMHAELKVNRHQRFLERMTAWLGRPSFFYLTLCVVAGWIFLNLLDADLHLPVFDPAPFSWLQGTLGFFALLMTILVLTTQNRQAKLDERNKHLDLQVNLVVEHKVSKLIALVEELRRDMPTVKNRYDQEAEAMSESVDPQAVFLALDETLAEANPDEEQLILQSDFVMDVETTVTSRETRDHNSISDTEVSFSDE